MSETEWQWFLFGIDVAQHADGIDRTNRRQSLKEIIKIIGQIADEKLTLVDTPEEINVERGRKPSPARHREAIAAQRELAHMALDKIRKDGLYHSDIR